MSKVKKETKKNDVEKIEPDLSGLEQSFTDKNGNTILLKDLLTKEDWWEMKGRKGSKVILTHDGVKKIADTAGILTNPKYDILTQPNFQNNYQYLIQVTICDASGRCTTELGESNRSNLSSRGRGNPANMAQKRAYDRAVFRHVGITGLLGEDELEDAETPKDMEKLSEDEQQQIVPFVNDLLLAKNKADLTKFQTKMKSAKSGLNDNQLDYLRKLFKKKLAEQAKSF